MKNWKVAFWSCLTVLIIISLLAVYSLVDQAYRVTYHKVSYDNMEKDFVQIIEIINNTDLTKKQITEELENHALYEFMDFNSDTIPLNRALLIFDKDNLIEIMKL